MFYEDNRTQLVFDGTYVMTYSANNPAHYHFSDPHVSRHYDAYLNGSCRLWTKPLYDSAGGYYKHHGYKLMSYHTAKILALEQVPFRVYRAFTMVK